LFITTKLTERKVQYTMAYGVGTTRNILVGAAGVFISTADSTSNNWNTFFGKPVPPTTGPVSARRPAAAAAVASGPNAHPAFGGTLTEDGVATADAEWRGVGFTSEGLEVSYEPTFGDVEVDQLLDSALLFKQQMRVTANTTFAEATLENLITVWGLANSTLTKTGDTETLDIAAGSLGEEPLERSMLFVGKGPRTSIAEGNATDNTYRERIYHIKRAIQTESSSHALRRNEATTLPASFRLLPDPSASVATYGKIVDRVLS
jgi:hypothetical protein